MCEDWGCHHSIRDTDFHVYRGDKELGKQDTIRKKKIQVMTPRKLRSTNYLLKKIMQSLEKLGEGLENTDNETKSEQ